jgi:hypothetical protein
MSIYALSDMKPALTSTRAESRSLLIRLAPLRFVTPRWRSILELKPAWSVPPGIHERSKAATHSARIRHLARNLLDVEDYLCVDAAQSNRPRRHRTYPPGPRSTKPPASSMGRAADSNRASVGMHDGINRGRRRETIVPTHGADGRAARRVERLQVLFSGAARSTGPRHRGLL